MHMKTAYGLYFHIGETERKCFIEEIPDETTVLGKLLVFFSLQFSLKSIFVVLGLYILVGLNGVFLHFCSIMLHL